MAVRNVPPDAVYAVNRLQFCMLDGLRSLQGDVLESLGLGPSESPYQIIASRPYWRLRDYGPQNTTASLLIVAAPIKRPYIWDLSPSLSAIRYCTQRNLHVYLIEWISGTEVTGGYGVEGCERAISECISKISTNAAGPKPIIVGHSFGGTLAAIYAAAQPARIGGLVLLAAPLCFRPKQGSFRDALVSLVPEELPDSEAFPGSLLSYATALASPNTFIWERLNDATSSFTDPSAMEAHARVQRWILDEVALPGKLGGEIISWLYRENRFCRGELTVDGKPVGPHTMSVPVLSVVNLIDDVAPLDSVKPFLDDVLDARIIQYPGESGVCFQHLAPLIGRKAKAQVWPEIISWINSRNLAQTNERAER